MKKHLLLCTGILLLCFLKPNYSVANKAAAGELIYEWVSDSTYRFIFKLYIDCSGDTASLTVPLCLKNSCSTSVLSYTMNRWSGPLSGGILNGSKTPMGCYTGKTNCDSPASTLSGFREYWYTTTTTLPYKCNAWTAFTYINYRNASNNIQNSTAQQMYLECGLNNSGTYQGISSPVCTSKAVYYARLNNYALYYNYPIDPNGDSLTTEIVSTRTGTTTCADTATDAVLTPMTPPLSIPSYPFKVVVPLSVDKLNSSLTILPKQEGNNIVTVLIKKYRSGVLLGWVMRDINIVVNSYSSPPINISDAINLSGAIYNNKTSSGRYEGCINQQISFSFYCKSSNAGTKYLLSDNHLTTAPNATITYSQQLKDSVSCNFLWTPSLPTDTGYHYFQVTIKDTTCAPPGIVYYTLQGFPIYIWGHVKALPDTTICSGGPVKLTAKTGGSYNWSIINGTPGSLSCTKCISPIANPKITSSYAVISTVDSFCPNINKDTVTITVDQTYPRTIGCDDKRICIGDKIQLSVLGGTGNYTWTILPGGDSSSLSCYNCADPQAAPDTTTHYLVYSNPNTCYFNNDTVTLEVRQKSTFLPSIYIEQNIPNPILPGQYITFTAHVTDCQNYMLQWKRNNIDIPGEINNTWTTNTIKNNDTITCKLKCSMECPISDPTPSSNMLIISVLDTVKQKPEINKDFAIVPNPNNGKFSLQVPNGFYGDVEITNILGQVIYTSTTNNKEIDLGHIPGGVYLLRISGEAITFSQRFVVEK